MLNATPKDPDVSMPPLVGRYCPVPAALGPKPAIKFVSGITVLEFLNA
jgi:hypothetical protein